MSQSTKISKIVSFLIEIVYTEGARAMVKNKGGEDEAVRWEKDLETEDHVVEDGLSWRRNPGTGEETEKETKIGSVFEAVRLIASVFVPVDGDQITKQTGGGGR
ncbi:hypothetical protein L2E82_50757 [Cichorium intybus]|nr:hypothetical protein L2E82_50757 [Cichorium intybus]